MVFFLIKNKKVLIKLLTIVSNRYIIRLQGKERKVNKYGRND